MPDEKIYTAFFTVFENASIMDDKSILLQKAFPNVNFSGAKPYLSANILPAPVSTAGLNIDIYEGVFQVAVSFPHGAGELTILRVCKQIKDLFPRNTILTQDGLKIYLEKTGWISPAVISGDNYTIPVSIPYKALD